MGIFNFILERGPQIYQILEMKGKMEIAKTYLRNKNDCQNLCDLHGRVCNRICDNFQCDIRKICLINKIIGF